MNDEQTFEEMLEEMSAEAFADSRHELEPQASSYNDDEPEEVHAYERDLAEYEEASKAPFTLPLPRNITMEQLFLDDNLDMLVEMVSGEIVYRLAEDQDPTFGAFQQTDKWLVLGLAMSEKNRQRFEVVWNDTLNKALELNEAMNDDLEDMDGEYEDDYDPYTDGQGWDDDPFYN